MMVDLIVSIASETLTSLYVIAFVTGPAIILSKKPCFFLKTTSLKAEQDAPPALRNFSRTDLILN